MNLENNMLVARQEFPVDYDSTAKLGTLAFDKPGLILGGDHLKWFYEQSFSRGSTVIGLFNGTEKVGQIAMVNQLVVINGKEENASQLVDLFIEKSYRGKRALSLLYGEVEKQFASQKIRFAFGVPNVKAIRVNEHFFQLKPNLQLQVRMGLSLPLSARKADQSFRFSPALEQEVVALGDRFATPDDENGLKWDGAKLYNRLCAKKFCYALHATENLLLISSPRVTRGIKHTLLCGFFRKANGRVSSADIRRVTRSACATWESPLFVYAGYHAALPYLPGFSLSRRIHNSPMLLQVRDFFAERGTFEMDRFQMVDIDFA